MKALHDLGLAQGVLPPQERPNIDFLKRCGFTGSDTHVIQSAAKIAPQLLQAAASASSMWVANAATVSPSADSGDHKVHFTAANLVNKLHRCTEDQTTSRILKAIFSDRSKFVIHPSLPHHESFGDEGAANHTRLCCDYGCAGLEFFVYGQDYLNLGSSKPNKYPARQTKQASEAIIRLHQINDHNVLLAQQNPKVIDQGVFHNDVIAVGNKNVLFYHAQAFCDTLEVEKSIRLHFKDQDFYFIKVEDSQVSVDDAIKSYLFNSQIVTLSDNSMALILPLECELNKVVWHYLQELKSANNPINSLIVKDLRQSMSNGGGPACLRLRVVLTDDESAAINQKVIINSKLLHTLELWIDRHYRDELDIQSLADPQLLDESRTALDELTKILNLGSIYPFQQ